MPLGGKKCVGTDSWSWADVDWSGKGIGSGQVTGSACHQMLPEKNTQTA